jgi:hypothetical protein
LLEIAKNIRDLACDSRSQFLETLNRNGFALESGRQTLTNILQDEENKGLSPILR